MDTVCLFRCNVLNRMSMTPDRFDETDKPMFVNKAYWSLDITTNNVTMHCRFNYTSKDFYL